VAIDGPAGSGKSAVGRRVAMALEVPFVDSGLMYRAVAHEASRRGVDPGDGAALTRLAHALRIGVDGRRVTINGQDRSEGVFRPEMSDAASRIAKVAGVRLAMVAQQRAMARGGLVMAGRDIGTVVFPDTAHKFYLTASLDERVRRRAGQIEARGERADPELLRREVEERDRRDSQRSVAPMRPAEDAFIIDTGHLTVEEVVGEVLRRIGDTV
jgi:cytidylate kinase